MKKSKRIKNSRVGCRWCTAGRQVEEAVVRSHRYSVDRTRNCNREKLSLRCYAHCVHVVPERHSTNPKKRTTSCAGNRVLRPARSISPIESLCTKKEKHRNRNGLLRLIRAKTTTGRWSIRWAESLTLKKFRQSFGLRRAANIRKRKGPAFHVPEHRSALRCRPWPLDWTSKCGLCWLWSRIDRRSRAFWYQKGGKRKQMLIITVMIRLKWDEPSKVARRINSCWRTNRTQAMKIVKWNRVSMWKDDNNKALGKEGTKWKTRSDSEDG